MSLFKSIIDQAAKMGFQEVPLTPINGEVFLDKNFIERLRYIEDSSLAATSFYTNFVGANTDALHQIFELRKIREFHVSIYGHDRDSFKRITGRGDQQYERIKQNLRDLTMLIPLKPDMTKLAVSYRTYRSFNRKDRANSELVDLVEKLGDLGAEIGQSAAVDNWGGIITHDDIADIEMDLFDGSRLYKNGPCALPFDSIQITATGQVNACACRDPKGSLKIGDINKDPLSKIISKSNGAWMSIVEGQEKGHFNDVCRACGFYKSIYDPRRLQPTDKVISKEEYFNRL